MASSGSYSTHFGCSRIVKRPIRVESSLDWTRLLPAKSGLSMGFMKIGGMVISIEQAQDLVRSVVVKESGRQITIVEGSTIERPFGWIFFYNSTSYLVGNDGSARLVGNAPIIVNKHSGTLSRTGTSFRAEQYAEAYEALGRERYDAGEWRSYLQKYVEPFDDE